jgi:hypothetical protein
LIGRGSYPTTGKPERERRDKRRDERLWKKNDWKDWKSSGLGQKKKKRKMYEGIRGVVIHIITSFP